MGAQLGGSQVATEVASAGVAVVGRIARFRGVVAGGGGGGLGVAAVDVALPQIAMYPASMVMSPLMTLLQMAQSGSAGTAVAAANAAAGLGADMPKFVGDAVPEVKPMGGAGGLGAGMAGGFG